MAKKRTKNTTDNTSDKVDNNVEGVSEEKTSVDTSDTASDTASDKDTDLNATNTTVGGDKNYIDSDSSDIAKSLTAILSVPTETIDVSQQQHESKESVLSGYGSDGNDPINPNFSGSEEKGADGEAQDFSDVDSGLFEDNSLLSEIGIELIDMLMAYGAMAIAKDWDNEDKYSISAKRKKKLQAPLEKILESREVKTAPELVFALMLIASYSPLMIEAVQERKRKKAASTSNPIQNMRAVSTPSKKAETTSEDNISVIPQRQQEVETPDDEDAMAEMMAKMQTKRKAGRPVGSTDLKVRVSHSDEDREKQINKAKAFRKDGMSFSRIAKELNVSEATATRWVRS
jgi:hypothetical protein